MNEFERREAKHNKDYKPEKGVVKATWIYTGLVIAIFLFINFGVAPLRKAIATTPLALLWWESMWVVSVMFLCIVGLWIFYFIKLIKNYKVKKALPPKYWSAWGIIKKSIAVILTVLSIFVFVKNLTNTIKDANNPQPSVTLYITDITSETEDVATFEYVETYDDWILSKTNTDVIKEKKKAGTCYLFNGLDLTCNAYEFEYFKHTNTFIAVSDVRISTKTLYVTNILSETEDMATFEYLEDYDDWMLSNTDSTILQEKKKTETCYLGEGVDLTCGAYAFRIFDTFEDTRKYVAVSSVEISTTTLYVSKVTSNEGSSTATFEYFEQLQDWEALKEGDETVLERKKTATCALYKGVQLTEEAFEFRVEKYGDVTKYIAVRKA